MVCLRIKTNHIVDNGLLKETLEKFKAGECTEEEIQHLHRWLDTLEADSTAIDLEEDQLQVTKHESWVGILPVVSQQTKIRQFWPKIGWAAAIFLIVSLTTIYFALKENLTSPKQIAVSTDKQQVKKIILPDGSKVWLDAGTTLEYKNSSTENDRVVTLRGHAFFEVKRDTLRPFVVSTFGITTTVLGTSFAIRAYPQSSSVWVSVVSGKVKVSNAKNAYLLMPSDRATVQKKDHRMQLDRIDTAQVKAWTIGEISLHNATLAEVLLVLEQYYGVSFKAHLKTEDGNFTLKFNQKLSIDQVLEIIQTVSFQPKIRFEKKEKVIHVYQNQTQ